MAILQTEKITALYERLSRDYDPIGDSNSIINQKKYLESYAEQKGYGCCVHYTNDGWSGGNFDRPAWKKLVADIEAGKVAHVIVKDMSRIGRDYLQTGFYTEVMFRQHGVHFVAIANSVDSDDQNSNEFAPFLNIMNEWYLRDLSRKQRTAIRVKGELGKPTTNCAIYGYLKDPNDKYRWLINEGAAAVVRKIYRLTIEGLGPFQIARRLYEEKIETPAVYFGKKGMGVWKSKEHFEKPIKILIAALRHSWSSSWTTDGNNHWHNCTRSGCTSVNNKTAHSGGTATCQTQATCSVCGQKYGSVGEHNYSDDWTPDTAQHQADSDIEVLKNNVIKTKTADYKISGNTNLKLVLPLIYVIYNNSSQYPYSFIYIYFIICPFVTVIFFRRMKIVKNR